MEDWSGVATAYRRSFASLCAGTIGPMLDAVARPSRKIQHLDVGCGSGELVLAAAARGWSVTAVDADPGMVALTRAALSGSPAGHGGATALRASSPTLPFRSGSFDAVTANFLVNHVPDPRATVRDLARVAAPSARVALAIWTTEPGPHLTAYGRAAQAAGALGIPGSRLPPGLDFPRTADGLARLSEEAGLVVERTGELRWTWRTAADDLMAGITGGVATPGRIHAAQTPAVRADIECRVRALWDEYRGDDGLLAFPVVAAFVLAEPSPGRAVPLQSSSLESAAAPLVRRRSQNQWS